MAEEKHMTHQTHSPQTENGYTRIANELLEAIMSYPFSRREFALILAIIRKTYGFSRKEDAVSGWQLSEMTKIDRSHVSKSLSSLIEKNIIHKSDRCRNSHGQEVHFLSLNKHYSEWTTVAETATVAKSAPLPKQPQTVAELATVTVAELAHRPLPKQPTHKESIKERKETNKRKGKTYLPPDFSISDRVNKWAMENGHKNLEQHLESFILKCNAKGYEYIDWDSAFMNAIRDDWAGLKKQNGGNGKSIHDTRAETIRNLTGERDVTETGHRTVVL